MTKIYAFVKSNSGTENHIEKEGLTHYPHPTDADNPDPQSDEVILVLHAGQPPDDDSDNNVTPYECFAACMEALLNQDALNPKYSKHQAWIKAHSDNIKGIVLTSGGHINLKKVLDFKRLLRDKRPTVLFESLSVDELNEAIRQDRLIDVLKGEDKLELGLQTLLAILSCMNERPSIHESPDESSPAPVGLDAADEDQALPAAAAADAGPDEETAQVEFEDFVGRRYRAFLEGSPDDWTTEVSKFTPRISVIDRALEEAAVGKRVDWLLDFVKEEQTPLRLDDALKLLASSSDKFRSRMRAFRNALLPQSVPID